MIYNPNKLKQILPLKSYQSMECVINGVIDSSILPEIFKNVYHETEKKNQLKRDKKNG